MSPLYEALCLKHNWTCDEELVKKMKDINEAELKTISVKLEDAVTNAGDTEVLDCMFEKARYLSKIGDWEVSWVAYDEILNKEKVGTGKKIDATMEKARIALFNMDKARMKETVAEAKALNEIGGDWDRRNRLKVYEAYYLMSIRDLKGASKLLLDCVATFTCVELCTYKQFMFYTLLTCLIALDRNDLRKKIIDDPHVITIVRELPNERDLVNSMYNCDYKVFFQTILATHTEILADRFLGPATVYLVREFRVLAYAQFLEAYSSVMLSSMAASFGISTTLLDTELSRFIASGRLNAKIDKVGDIIETSRPDKKNAQYQDVIKKGDNLLNQIQKLVRAIDV
eukprot:CAMPEP_0181294512 /NCGR_PEP_ID=MMETSP1101-20121128/3643_1 /TAXON_ID=46948 /ORGANISM="Rhodomonas abbreviata, Strain Caron Lab Isolate" /LENGTH=341 /DNA_ID=CAMNT_0023399181 /DNA_START=157 /DNA_END=1182 /DNA_ORIENTATION=+